MVCYNRSRLRTFRRLARTSGLSCAATGFLCGVLILASAFGAVLGFLLAQSGIAAAATSRRLYTL